MTTKTITVDMDLKLYDGNGGAAAAAGSTGVNSQSTAAQSTQQSNGKASPEDLSLARANGIPDRLAADYAAAKRKMAQQSAQPQAAEESENTAPAAAQTNTGTEDRSARFSELIREGGEFHEDYTNRLNENLSRRMKSVNEQNAKLSKQAEGYNQISQLVALFQSTSSGWRMTAKVHKMIIFITYFHIKYYISQLIFINKYILY